MLRYATQRYRSACGTLSPDGGAKKALNYLYALASPSETWIEYVPQSISKDIEREHGQRDEQPWSNRHMRGEHEES